MERDKSRESSRVSGEDEGGQGNEETRDNIWRVCKKWCSQCRDSGHGVGAVGRDLDDVTWETQGQRTCLDRVGASGALLALPALPCPA